MKDTIDGIIGLAIVSGIVVGSFISGYAMADNYYLRRNVATLTATVKELTDIIDAEKKEEVPEEKTED